MEQLGTTGGLGLDKPPSSRELASSRAELQQRFRESLSHANTSAGARVAAETLLTAAITENDRSLKWLMLDESRRLGEAAGQASLVNRAITMAAAVYDFDAIDLELRCLKLDKAVSATLLAYRAWQRAGNKEAAHQAAMRHDALVQAK
jgi:hypothetical protein